jgi:parallel beta-helix repeat protein
MRTIAALLLVGLGVAPAAPAVADNHRVIHVRPGQSIQNAVERAEPGDTVIVGPGTYREAGRACPGDPTHRCAVVISRNDITLRGQGGAGRRVVLENAGNQTRGIAVARPDASGASCLNDSAQRLRGVRVEGFTVNGFGHDGIFLLCVDDWVVAHNATHSNAEYGIFPSHSRRGRVTDNVATGSNDTGIYVGQSSDVRVDDNLAMSNVSGFEIENSTGVVLRDNQALGNTGGILSFTLPFLDVKSNHDNVIADNEVLANNKTNTCVDPDDAVCQVPSGTGILVLAADRNRVRDNEVRNNNSFGIGVANYCVALGLSPAKCSALDIDPDPDGNRIVDNTVRGNGHSPDPSVPSVFAVDLAWDTTGAGNCWRANRADTTFPPTLPTCA